jgi:hypothetical protein
MSLCSPWALHQIERYCLQGPLSHKCVLSRAQKSHKEYQYITTNKLIEQANKLLAVERAASLCTELHILPREQKETVGECLRESLFSPSAFGADFRFCPLSPEGQHSRSHAEMQISPVHARLNIIKGPSLTFYLLFVSFGLQTNIVKIFPWRDIAFFNMLYFCPSSRKGLACPGSCMTQDMQICPGCDMWKTKVYYVLHFLLPPLGSEGLACPGSRVTQDMQICSGGTCEKTNNFVCFYGRALGWERACMSWVMRDPGHADLP